MADGVACSKCQRITIPSYLAEVPGVGIIFFSMNNSTTNFRESLKKADKALPNISIYMINESLGNTWWEAKPAVGVYHGN